MKRSLPLLALLLCAACAASVSGAPAAPDDAAAASAVDRVALALLAGSRAEQGSERWALRAASRALAIEGARPAGEAQADLAARWNGLAGGTDRTLPLYRGRALGPAYRDARLRPGAELALEQIFLGGHKAEVALVPVSGGELILEIRQAGEKAICQASADPPPAKCSWIPLYTARHELKVRNAGRRDAAFLVVTN